MFNIRPVHFLTALLMLCSLAVVAQKKKKKSQAPAADTIAVKKPVATDSAVKKTVNPYATIVTPATITKKGLFTIHQTGDRYYFELPDSIMGRQVLSTSWLEQTPEGSSMYAGERINGRAFYFENDRGKKINIIGSVNTIAVDTTEMVFKAISDNNAKTVLLSFDIKATSPDKNVIIDVTDLFLKDNMMIGLGDAKRALGASK